MAQIDAQTDAIVGDWLTVPEVAGRLSLPVSRVKQLLRERKLLGAQRPGGTFSVPAAFLEGGQAVRGLAGTLILLADCGFTDEESLRWLFTADETLPGTPIQAIAEHRSTEVNRRAQALAF
ncbi:MAG: Rv2175c family DNA-binding protein [Streptosporangiaceae bacterium]